MVSHFADPEVMLAYHNAWAFDDSARRLLLDATVEKSELNQRPISPFKQSNGLLQMFRAELRRFDDLWDNSVDQIEGNVILAHDQWYFFLALLLGKVVFVDRELLDYRQHANNTLGVKVSRSLLSQVMNRLSHFGDQDRWAALSAQRRADTAAEIQQATGRSLDEIVALYRQVATRLERRANTYSEPRLWQRARSLGQSLGAGDYGAYHGFKASSVVRDLYSGVLLRKTTDPSRAPRP